MHQRTLTCNSKHLMIIRWVIVAFTNDKIQTGGSWNRNKVRLWLTFLNSLSFTSEAAKMFLFANLFIFNVSDYASRSDLAAHAAPVLVSTLLSPCPLRPFACLPWKAAVISSRQLSKEVLSHTPSGVVRMAVSQGCSITTCNAGCYISFSFSLVSWIYSVEVIFWTLLFIVEFSINAPRVSTSAWEKFGIERNCEDILGPTSFLCGTEQDSQVRGWGASVGTPFSTSSDIIHPVRFCFSSRLAAYSPVEFHTIGNIKTCLLKLSTFCLLLFFDWKMV